LSFPEILMPVKIMADLGARLIIFTCAVGGICEDLYAGEIVVIKDHLNLTGYAPLRGIGERWGKERFIDMTNAYSPELINCAWKEAHGQGFDLRQCVYAGVAGPCYETPAEISMINRLGGDVVGMSLVSEVMMTRYLGIDVLAFCCVTNVHKSGHKVSHNEVVKTADESIDSLGKLIKGCAGRYIRTETYAE
ncbi:MAG: purine-nucleoside phosphorylase, partial [Candidatus Theseobacter exili]|nr:purine-nucleoside phosphorylase [Candidatus Theseobacter exili]